MIADMATDQVDSSLGSRDGGCLTLERSPGNRGTSQAGSIRSKPAPRSGSVLEGPGIIFASQRSVQFPVICRIHFKFGAAAVAQE